MPVLTQHAPGTFCWPELASSDQNAAKKFYGEIFGWQFVDMDMGPEHGFYTIFNKGGKDVAALFTQTPDMKAKGVPPYWGAYVAVESADAAAKKAAELGATVLMAPFDVMDKGRMAVLLDPAGAAFCVWQSNTSHGVTMLDEPGALCWTELLTTDIAKCKAFYTGLLPWSHAEMPFGDLTYHVFSRTDGAMAGGMLQMPPDVQAPPNWLSYFQVENCDATVEKVKSLGGKVWVAPQDAGGIGRFSVLADPQGATFAVLQPAER